MSLKILMNRKIIDRIFAHFLLQWIKECNYGGTEDRAFKGEDTERRKDQRGQCVEGGQFS